MFLKAQSGLPSMVYPLFSGSGSLGTTKNPLNERFKISGGTVVKQQQQQQQDPSRFIHWELNYLTETS